MRLLELICPTGLVDMIFPLRSRVALAPVLLEFDYSFLFLTLGTTLCVQDVCFLA